MTDQLPTLDHLVPETLDLFFVYHPIEESIGSAMAETGATADGLNNGG